MAGVAVLAGLAVGVASASTLLSVAVGLCLAALPVATGAAVLRYRLYDLDRIISRTGRVIAAFGARLRDQVDLDTLTTELVAVVDQTIQPTRTSLWLRAADAAGPGPAGTPEPRPSSG